MQQVETRDRCKGCRKEQETRAHAKEERRDAEAAQEGLKVPGGTLTWYPAVKNVFGKIGGMFRGKNDSYSVIDEEEVNTLSRKSREQ